MSSHPLYIPHLIVSLRDPRNGPVGDWASRWHLSSELERHGVKREDTYSYWQQNGGKKIVIPLICSITLYFVKHISWVLIRKISVNFRINVIKYCNGNSMKIKIFRIKRFPIIYRRRSLLNGKILIYKVHLLNFLFLLMFPLLLL